MPWIVKSPLTCALLPFTECIRVEVNEMAGYLSTSKKSALFKWSSRFWTPVNMLDASMDSSIEELVMFRGSK
jgi:hypothetical protein